MCKNPSPDVCICLYENNGTSFLAFLKEKGFKKRDPKQTTNTCQRDLAEKEKKNPKSHKNTEVSSF